MRIIGIDPGTVTCGYGIIESRVKSPELTPDSRLQTPNSKLQYIASGDIKLKKDDPLPVRLKVLYESLNSIISEYEPTHLCVEKIFYHRSIRSAFALGSTRGVVLLLSAQNDIPVFEYNSTEMKMALTGYGRADKQQVQEMVKKILGLNSSSVRVRSHRSNPAAPDRRFSKDSTDALALCICHIHSSRVQGVKDSRIRVTK